MSKQRSNHLSTLSRRDFLKLLGTMVVTTGVANGCTTDARTPVGATGYGSGGYGMGKYGAASSQHSTFLPVTKR